MKELKLFVDFEFTSLSPDVQPISIGVVSEDILTKQVAEDFLSGNNNPCLSKSFYSEFSDFDINRCGDWVKTNVVGKLTTNLVAEKLGISFECAKDAAKTSTNWSKEYCILKLTENEIALVGNTWRIKEELKTWLSQFSDYQITFVVDCGTWDWYHLLQLIGEWEEKKREVRDGDEIYDITSEKGILISSMGDYELIVTTKTGLPKLPSNISPVPFELNQFIADKKGISVREAFDLNREELAYAENYKVMNSKVPVVSYKKGGIQFMDGELDRNKHNALFDCKVMKAIYEKLSV